MIKGWSIYTYQWTMIRLNSKCKTKVIMICHLIYIWVKQFYNNRDAYELAWQEWNPWCNQCKTMIIWCCNYYAFLLLCHTRLNHIL